MSDAASGAGVGVQRVFLDCTGTYFFDSNSGIQRLVRNVVLHGPNQGRRVGIAVIPCYFEEGRYFVAPTTSDGRLICRASDADPQQGWPRARARYWSIMRGVVRAVPGAKLRDWLLAPAVRPGLARALRSAFKAARVYPSVAKGEVQEAISFRAGDVLLTLDLACEHGVEVARAALVGRGVGMASVFYDLIPLRHPEGLPQSFIDAFARWMNIIIRPADLVVGISNVVIADLADYFSMAPLPQVHPHQARSRFRMGHELDQREQDPSIRPDLERAFAEAAGARVFLSVGWLDLRKNQLLVLDALKILSAQGSKPRWIIAGRRGPTTDVVLQGFRDAPELAGRIFIYHDLSDAELDYCYRHASALIYPSVVEGFGLPMIEAMSRGLRVFASDIPVFREVGADFVVFFPLDQPEILASLLGRFFTDGHFPARRDVSEFKWPDWAACTCELLDIVRARFSAMKT